MSDKREIIEIKESWPIWLTVLTTLLNFIGIFIFLFVFYNIREIVLDNLFLKCFEEATVVEDGDYYNCKVAKTDFNGWKTAKQIIRESLPYPE